MLGRRPSADGPDGRPVCGGSTTTFHPRSDVSRAIWSESGHCRSVADRAKPSWIGTTRSRARPPTNSAGLKPDWRRQLHIDRCHRAPIPVYSCIPMTPNAEFGRQATKWRTGRTHVVFWIFYLRCGIGRFRPSLPRYRRQLLRHLVHKRRSRSWWAPPSIPRRLRHQGTVVHLHPDNDYF